MGGNFPLPFAPYRKVVEALKTQPALMASWVFLFVLSAVNLARLESFFSPLDWVNLAFHEGGHIIFGISGLRFVMVLGGTMMQLLLPAAAVFQFLKDGRPLSADIALVWLGENFLNIGTYAADARAQKLELVAGGVHDWTYLLETTGLLIHDEAIGRGLSLIGCALMSFAAVAAWVHWRELRPSNEAASGIQYPRQRG